MGQEKLSPFLIKELEKNESQYRNYLIEALGNCGRVNAVEKLLEIGKSTLNPLLRSSVKEAIIKIQSRLGNADKGWLSVTQLDEIDGALSLADRVTDGSLSLVNKRLSIRNKDLREINGKISVNHLRTGNQVNEGYKIKKKCKT